MSSSDAAVASARAELVLARLGLPKDDPIAAVLETIEQGRADASEELKATLMTLEACASQLQAQILQQQSAAKALYEQNSWAFRWRKGVFALSIAAFVVGSALGVGFPMVALRIGWSLPIGNGMSLQRVSLSLNERAFLIKGSEVQRVSRTPEGGLLVVTK